MSLRVRATDAASGATQHAPSSVLSLDRQYWTFFAGAFFFDAGFAVYFFLFNLYLLEAHWNERSIGLVGGAFTLGSMLATLPAGEIARRFGIRKLLFACFISAPILGVARVLWLSPYAQITCGLLAGAAMSLWGVAYLPAIARIVPAPRRAAAYSLIFTASLITSAFGVALCGLLPTWMAQHGILLSPLHFRRAALVVTCGIAFLGIVPLLGLRLPPTEESEPATFPHTRGWTVSPFLRRYLICIALWAAIIASFSPFANVYLAHERHVPLRTISMLFSSVQILQILLGVALPYVLRMLGLQHGLLLIQLCAAFALAVLAIAPASPVFAGAYVGFSAAQWMSLPALYTSLMNNTPAAQRQSAAALTMFLNTLLAAVATPLAGAAFAHFGYKPILLGIATVATGTALLFYRTGRAYGSPTDEAVLCSTA